MDLSIFNDWTTTKQAAEAHGMNERTMRAKLLDLARAGVLERKAKREIRTLPGTKWEQRPIVMYYRKKGNET